MSDKALYVELNNELERIHAEVGGLMWNQHVFWEVQRMMRNNKALRGKSATFNKWMGNMYAGAMSAGVRRVIDKDKRCISLIHLLERVKANPSCFSREAYKERCTNLSLPTGYLDRDYDKLIGVGRNQPIPAEIDKEVNELQKRTRLVKEFVNEHVAHASKAQKRTKPTFQDLDDTIEYLDGVVRRYLHLFRGASMRTLLPTELYDWKDVFRYAWLEENDAQTKALP